MKEDEGESDKVTGVKCTQPNQEAIGARGQKLAEKKKDEEQIAAPRR